MKLVNDSYIINGEFAISLAGSYEAAGARFVYSRAGGQDSVFAHGPLQQPVDIMVILLVLLYLSTTRCAHDLVWSDH